MAIRAPANQAPAIALDGAASAIASARRAVLADRYAGEFIYRRMAGSRASWRRSSTSGATLPTARSSRMFSTSRPLRSRRRRCSGAMPARCWSGREPSRAGSLASFRRASKSGATASICRSLSAGRIPTRRSACRWSSARRPSRSWLPGLRISPPMQRCRDCCCCRICRSTGHSPRRWRQSAGARKCRPPISIAMSGRSWRRAGERSHYVEQALGKHHHKELRRCWRRLSETGAVLLTTATEPAAVAAAIEDFLTLEASGWKGRAGTAAAGRQDLQQLHARGSRRSRRGRQGVD